MKTSIKLRVIIDVLMPFILIFLMGFMITGDFLHEVIGTIMIMLWVVHNYLIRRWYMTLTKGHYTLLRTINTMMNFLLLICAFYLMYSGVIISSHVFSFMNIEMGMTTASKIHVVSAYWCFVLSSLHFGLHWSQMIHFFPLKKPYVLPKKYKMMVWLALGIVCVYGVYALIKQQIFSYMLMTHRFVLFDYEQTAFSFFGQYVSMLVLFTSLSYLVTECLKKKVFLIRS